MDEPHLPPELEHVIFEMAFNPDDLVSNTNMVLVARRIRECIFIQEGDFMPQSLKNFPDFQKYNGLNAAELGKFAKSLHFGATSKRITSHSLVQESIQKLIRQCPNVENLACWYGVEDPSVTLAPIFEGSSKLRKLSIDCSRHAAVIETDAQRFRDMWANLNSRSLTHLDFMDCPSTWPFEVLSGYSKLTHFTAYGPRGWTAHTIRHILNCCPGLQVFILHMHLVDYYDDSFGKPDDFRVVLVEDVSLSSDDWLEGAKGRFNTCTFAAQIVYARKCKYFIEGTDFWDRVGQPFNWDVYLTPDGKKWYTSLFE